MGNWCAKPTINSPGLWGLRSPSPHPAKGKDILAVLGCARCSKPGHLCKKLTELKAKALELQAMA